MFLVLACNAAREHTVRVPQDSPEFSKTVVSQFHAKPCCSFNSQRSQVLKGKLYTVGHRLEVELSCAAAHLPSF